MFIIVLTVIALADYVITFCCIVNMVAKPTVKTVKLPEYISEGDQTMSKIDMGFVCEDKEFSSYEKNFNTYDKDLNNYDKDINSYIEEQNSRIALLSSNVNEILSNIDAIIERSETNQRVVSV